MTCGTCRWWGEATNLEGKHYRQAAGEFRQCGRVVGPDTECPSDGPLLAKVVDGSGYYAALKCRSDFGCVLHEPAEVPS